MKRFDRSDRLADQIKREVGDILSHKLKTHTVSEVTIIDVELSGDCREATVFYSVLGDEEVQQEAADKLRRVSGFVQSEVGHRLRIRHTPKLHFQYDASVQRGMRIDELLRSIDAERQNEDDDAQDEQSSERN